MHIDAASYSDIGGRAVNEDSTLVGTYADGALIAAVADGLGGHGGGDVASALALRQLDVFARETFPRSEEALQRVCAEMNRAILDAQKEHPHMKTTLAMIAACDGTLACVHIGDSRVYCFHDGAIRYQSADHSVSQMAVLMGEITSDQIRFHEDRSKLLRSLGSEGSAAPEIRLFETAPGQKDAVLLCSDGFWEFVKEKEMLGALKRTKTAKDWLERMRLLVARRSRGKGDNNSAIAVRFFPE